MTESSFESGDAALQLAVMNFVRTFRLSMLLTEEYANELQKPKEA